MLSCFLKLDRPLSESFREIQTRANLIRSRLGGQARSDFDDAFRDIESYLNLEIQKSTRGVVIYSRWGDDPVFLPLQFAVPIESQLIVGSLPHIYPLIELKDTYHRFVIVIATSKEARILETTIGSVTEDILTERPELRERVGREWTVERYQNHKHEREQQFVREKVAMIEDLMSRKGHNHLIVTGSTKMASRLTKALPTHLQEKVISTFSANPNSGLSPILLESIRLFVEAENAESHSLVELLEARFLSGGLAVIGYEACREMLLINNADALVVDQNFDESEQREELVRLANERSVPIETVSCSDTLVRLGGVGCLLRYLPRPDALATSSVA